LGNAYVTGNTSSSNFPTTPGAFQTTLGGPSDAFVSKLNAAGSALVYSTYLGGSGGEGRDVHGIAVDVSGNAYVTGDTESSDFPTTAGAFQTSLGGVQDAFVSKLNAAGTALVYSTYLGGSNEDGASFNMAVNSFGDVYIAGYSLSSDFPTTPGAFQTACAEGGGAFVSKVNAGGSGLLYSTYLCGGLGSAIAVNASGNAYVTGITFSSGFPTTPSAFQTTFGGNADGFVTKLNGVGSGLLYSTYLGGSDFDQGTGIALDASGNAYVTGDTESSNFPTTAGGFQTTYRGSGDFFVSKVNASGSALAYSSYLGGSGGEGGAGSRITLDSSGNVYISGGTGSSDFPATPSAFRTTFAGGVDTFVGKISPADAPGIALAPGSLTFGPQPVDTTSAPETFALLDAGSLPLSISSIVASSDFAQTNNCGSAVQPGAPCRLSVTFRPSTTGTRSGAITITDDAQGSPHKLLLTGTGTSGSGPVVSLKPASLPFLLLRTAGTTSPAQTVKLTNVGSPELNITGITLTGPDPQDFAQSNNCPPTVASGASCLITVTFTPTAQGVRAVSILITDSAPGSPQTVPLSGRATFFEWSPRSLNMGSQKVGTSSAARTVTLTNVGTSPITLFSIGIGGVNPGDFSETNTCGGSLKAGASCTIEVTFTPTAVGGRIGRVAIHDNAFGGTHWVGLLGKGT
jgi:hypothetical protein